MPWFTFHVKSAKPLTKTMLKIYTLRLSLAVEKIAAIDKLLKK